MKKIITTILIIAFLIPYVSYADEGWAILLLTMIRRMYQLDLDLKNMGQEELNEMRGIKTINQSQLNETKRISSSLIGTHQYGSQYYNAQQFSWGANNWQSILSQANAGSGEGALGSLIQKLSADFPINHTFESANDIENKYYLMQAQTALATRASAEVAFDQMNNEDQTIKLLHGLIDHTPDNKSAVDLNNRLLAENTRVNIQQAKLLAVLLQQISINSQAKANRASENATFFDIK
jgi:hypothetical protein